MSRQRTPTHTLERRSDMLASAIKKRVSALEYAVKPPGGRPPFTRKQTAAETLAWWRAHRFDELGLAILQHMTPVQIAELDAWLSAAANHPATRPAAAPGTPTLTRPLQPGGPSILTRAMGQETRMQGPPVGSEVA